MARPVWSTSRKLMGNLIPMAGSLPFGVWAVLRMERLGRILGPELWILAAMPVAGWLLMNLFGLFHNGAMRRELAKRFKLGPPGGEPGWVFVGFARPSYRGALDPHEDVGFLLVHGDRLEFRGESLNVALRRDQIERIRFRRNVHTWVGLGRWVSVEGVLEGKPVRMLVEPRERPTLMGNLRYSAQLRERLDAWLKRSGPPPNRREPAVDPSS